MYKIAIGSAVMLMVILLIAGFTQKPKSYTATPQVEAPKQVIQKDNVSEAQRQLNEAKKLLDDEEKSILAEIKAKEERIEEIRKVRLSFSQAPKQVE